MAEKQQSNYFSIFDRPFSQRIKEGWDKFSEGEEKLRNMIDNKESAESIAEFCHELLRPAFSDVFFEVGFNGKKYELILSPEKEKFYLYFYEAFKKQAPQKITENWDIILGIPHSVYCEMVFHGKTVSPEDVTVKIEEKESFQLCVTGYCEKLVDILKENKDEALRFLSLLIDMTVSEIVSMRYIKTIDITDKPIIGDRKTFSLDILPVVMENIYGDDKEWDLTESYLQKYSSYFFLPNESSYNFIPREDVYVGFSCLPQVIRCCCIDDDFYTEKAIKEGAVIGYIYYTTGEFSEKANKKKLDVILDFQDEFMKYIDEKTSGTACCFIGCATGIYCSYLDFIAWDLKLVLDTAKEFFKSKKTVKRAAYKFYCLDTGEIVIYER
ncbi:MAG: hypothetical protein NC203_06665 [Firmicutes bacterium]|nr:hypothetical protein [[Eubacterium] siraeum]MCM1488029.1 hypothetical protein [Bacillota bacterium]